MMAENSKIERTTHTFNKLYIAGENIPAGFDVIAAPGISERVYGVGLNRRDPHGVILGKSAEHLREGFRVTVRDGEVYEDDA
jgi:hypothetical protein